MLNGLACVFNVFTRTVHGVLASAERTGNQKGRNGQNQIFFHFLLFLSWVSYVFDLFKISIRTEPLENGSTGF